MNTNNHHKQHQSHCKGAVLVTGTSSGIGKSCAIALADVGFSVFAGVRNITDSKQLQQEGRGKIIPIILDITSDKQVLAAKNIIAERMPDQGLVGLVNNAGISITGPLECIKQTDIREQFDVNVFGQLALIQALLPLLRKTQGRIINIGSTSGRIPSKFSGPYCASKSALDSITSILRMELLASGIKVSLVEPGVVASPFWSKISKREEKLAAELGPSNQKLYEASLNKRKLGLKTISHNGQPPDKVCRAVVSAMISHKPKPRYVVGRDALLKTMAWKYFPQWLINRMLDKRS